MKKFATLLAVLLTFALLTFVASADTLSGTLVRENNADPNLFFYDGNYYLTQTGTSRIAVFESSTLSGLDSLAINSNISYTAYTSSGGVFDPTVEELFGEGATIDGTWSPEIHYFSEEQFPGNSGWYMFLGLRQNTGDSSMVRMVVLKSTTDSPKGPYGHPTKGTKNYSQPLLDKDGNVWDEWGCGQTVLTIPEGEYKGIYAMWVAEEGRGSATGGKYGDFYQKIMIAKLETPWQLASDAGIITTPTQEWEYAGASTTHPRVVEGATPVYGKNGEIFLTYSGSGYWSDYGLGQLTWNGGDPLETSSWVKLPVANGNPIFTATTASDLRGAGHASFLTDTDGNGFFCYHAYAYDSTTETKASSRDAYIEPYYIDYTKWNGVSYGVIKLGLNGTGVAAPTSSKITFATDGEYLSAPSVSATGGENITLSLSCTDATGYIIYRSADGKEFNYLATADAASYTDTDVTAGNTYYYRAYAYREEEISDKSETVSAAAVYNIEAPVIESIGYGSGAIYLEATIPEYYDEIKIYRSTDGTNFSYYDSAWTIDAANEPIALLEDYDISTGTYYYYVVGVRDGYESVASNTVDMYVLVLDAPVITAVTERCDGITLTFTSDTESEGYTILRSDDGSYYTSIANIDGYTTSYTDTTVTVGSTYYYMITAIADDFESRESAEKEATAGHDIANGAELEATCTEDGYTAYTYCTYCNTVLSGKETVASKGHTYEVTEEEVPATTTSVGKTAVSVCSSCGDTIGGEEIPMLDAPDAFTLAGDANGDSTVNLIDALRALKATVGEDVEINTYNADMNGDGSVTTVDVLLILKAYLDA